MFKQIWNIKNWDNQTLFFYFNWGIYLLILIATTLHVYARLDYVRSYEKGKKYKTETSTSIPK